MGASEARYRQFVTEHQARIRLPDWPQLGTEDGEIYWLTLRKHLGDLGATLEVATEASILLAANPPRWLSEQQKALLDVVRRLMASARDTPPPAIRPTRPENRPGPWDAIRTLADLRDFLASLGPVAPSRGAGRPDAPSRPRRREGGPTRALPELANLALPPPDPDLERERQRQRAALSLRPPQAPQPEPPGGDDPGDLDGAF